MKRLFFLSLLPCLLFSCVAKQGPVMGNASVSDTNGGHSATATYPPVEIRFTDSTAVARHMYFLASDALKGRDTGSEGIAKAATYIETLFDKNGIVPYFSSYRDSLSNKRKAYNVVGYLEGNDATLKDEFVIIGAHYDHIGIGGRVRGDAIANGANDNASGTTAVLELARYFGKEKRNRRSMMFVLFSAEELGLLGSKHLARKLMEQDFNLYAMVNFEMIGVPMKGRDHIVYLSGYKRSNMADKLNEYAGKKLIGYSSTAARNYVFQRSDNYPFHREFRVPSQTICSFDFNNYPYYHHVDDEVDKMDFTHMATVVNEMISVLERMVNAPTKEIRYNK